MDSLPSNSIQLGRKYVAPDGTTVYAWPASDQRFLLLLQGALELQPSADSTTGGVPNDGVVFVSSKDVAASTQAISEFRASESEALICSVGESPCKTTDLDVRPDVERIQRAFAKLKTGELASPWMKKLSQWSALGVAAAIVIAAGWYFRKSQDSSSNVDWNKKAKRPEIVKKDIPSPSPTLTNASKAERVEKPKLYTAPGNIRYQHVVMTMPEPGRVIKVLVKDGQEISLGDKLVELENLKLKELESELSEQLNEVEAKFALTVTEFTKKDVAVREASAKNTTTQKAELAQLETLASNFDAQKLETQNGLEELEIGIATYKQFIEDNPAAASTYRRPLNTLKQQLAAKVADIQSLDQKIAETATAIEQIESSANERFVEEIRALAASHQKDRENFEVEKQGLMQQLKHAQENSVVIVSAQSAGVIASMRAEDGSVIGKGQPLMAIRRTDLTPEVVAYPDSPTKMIMDKDVSISNQDGVQIATGVIIALGSPEKKPAVRIKLEGFTGPLPPEGTEVLVSQLKK